MTMNLDSSNACVSLSLRNNGIYEIFSENVTVGNDMTGGTESCWCQRHTKMLSYGTLARNEVTGIE
jgi:hypothetical protein